MSVDSGNRELELYLACLDQVDEAVLVTDSNFTSSGPEILYINSAFQRLTGYSSGDVKGRSLGILHDPAAQQTETERLRATLEAAADFSEETVVYRKDGTSFPIQWSVQRYPRDADVPTHFIAVLRDVTEFRAIDRRRAQLEALNRIQRLVMTTGYSLDDLRRTVVEAAQEATGAMAAVVEEPEGDSMVYTAVCGYASNSLGMRIPVNASISGIAFREERTLICEDVLRDDRVKLKDEALAIGFRSAILVPLEFEDRCFGVLKVYHDRPAVFSDADRALLELASDVLGASLNEAYELENERRRQRILVDSLPVLVSYIDSEKIYREANAAYLDWFGLKAEQIVGHHVADVLGENAYDQVRPYMDAALAGERVTFETEVPYAHGGPRPVEADYSPHFGAHGGVEGFYVLVRDMSDRRRAQYDYLTEIYNRRAFEEHLAAECAGAQRHGRPLSLIFMDLDGFKLLNDTYGHAAGDAVLRHVARLLRRRIRASDIVCRWGGEEFVILLPETLAWEALELAGQLRGLTRSENFETVGKVTASFGVGQFDTRETREGFVSRVDRALYRAKASGRDCVIPSSGIDEDNDRKPVEDR